VIDVNRDPSGASLYPGQATTELCPTATFDGEPLYRQGREPDEGEIARRRMTYFAPYHDALSAELARLRASHPRVVLYDAHSIRSRIPRLFDGELAQFNIGTNSGAACDPALARAVEAACAGFPASPRRRRPFQGRLGPHATTAGRRQTCMRSRWSSPAAATWTSPPASCARDLPSLFLPERAKALRAALTDVLAACLSFARS
jgi:formiminoglutamase